jgi:hypothetical protein
MTMRTRIAKAGLAGFLLAAAAAAKAQAQPYHPPYYPPYGSPNPAY